MSRKIVKKTSSFLVFVLFTMIICKNFAYASINISYDYKDKVFVQDKVNEIYIEIDESEFQDMLDNPLDEEYKSANIIVNGNKLNNVAIRTKGNSSLTRVAEDSESNRYSFKIKMDEYQDQSLYGLEKLNLNNCYTDPSYMREYISYRLMEEMDLPTPANAYMKVYINDEEWGLYLAVENIEESFIRTNFETIDGDLYKPESLNYKVEDLNNFNIDDIKEKLNLKTNEYTSDYDHIEEFIKAINTNQNLEEYMDIDEFIRYFVVNTALVNLDSYQGNLLHNYYLYEENGKFKIIPWDYDLSFGVFGTMDTGMDEKQNKDPESNDFNNDFSPSDKDDNFNEYKNIIVPDKYEEEENNLGEQLTYENNNTENRDNMPTDFQKRKDKTMADNPRGNMSTINMSDSTINFPIDSPVSDYDIENYPMIYSWLSQEKYKEIYHQYLNEFIGKYFNESYINNLVGETAKLIQKSVLSDPNKKYTIDDFQDGYESIIEFTTLRNESIQKQLLGELESEKEINTASFKNNNTNKNPPSNMYQINDRAPVDTDAKSIKLNLAIAGIIIMALTILIFFAFKFPRRGSYQKK